MKDMLIDAWRGVGRRPHRTALTTSGVALGVGALVAIIGLAESASLQISLRFDAIAATGVEVTLPSAAGAISDSSIDSRARLLPGVRAAGTFTAVNPQTAPAVIAESITNDSPRAVPVIVASSWGLRAAEPIVKAGSLPTTWAESHDRRIAVVGLGIAREFGVWPESGRNVIRLNGAPFAVVGVVSDRATEALVSGAVAVSRRGGDILFPDGAGRTILVRTSAGYGQQVARALPFSVFPQNPNEVIVDVPPDPVALRGRISTDTKNLLLALAFVTLAGGALGIANTMLVSVLERTPEIGLRRALGASKRSIAALFLAESAFVGTAGGITGATLGILFGALLTSMRAWPYVLPPAILAAPLLGTLVGIVAGVYPSIRAATVNPVDSLRA